MVKRKEVTDLLKRNGFHSTGGTNHEHWSNGSEWTQVPRHREISNRLFEKIKKQAGLK